MTEGATDAADDLPAAHGGGDGTKDDAGGGGERFRFLFFGRFFLGGGDADARAGGDEGGSSVDAAAAPASSSTAGGGGDARGTAAMAGAEDLRFELATSRESRARRSVLDLMPRAFKEATNADFPAVEISDCMDCVVLPPSFAARWVKLLSRRNVCSVDASGAVTAAAATTTARTFESIMDDERERTLLEHCAPPDTHRRAANFDSHPFELCSWACNGMQVPISHA